MTQRWYLLIHGRVQEVTVDQYLTEAKRGQWMGITRKDGTQPSWDDFNALMGKVLGNEPSPYAHIAHGATDQFGVRERSPRESRPVKRARQTARPLAVDVPLSDLEETA